MPDLNAELNELASTLADANAQLIALLADSTPAQLASVRALITGIEQARLSAESRQMTLAARDTAASAATSTYFDAVAWARAALTTGGDLSPAAHGALREQLRGDLGLANLADLDTLLGEVQAYDAVGANAVDAARLALSAAESALATAEGDLAAQQTALDIASRALGSLAAQALAQATLSYQQLAALQSARGAGRFHEAVVHLQDLTRTREGLNAAIDLAAPGFDANETDAASLAGSLAAAWSGARDSYQAALVALIDAQETVFELRLALARAEADAQDRRARRLIDAAQQVADRQATL